MENTEKKKSICPHPLWLIKMFFAIVGAIQAIYIFIDALLEFANLKPIKDVDSDLYHENMGYYGVAVVTGCVTFIYLAADVAFTCASTMQKKKLYMFITVGIYAVFLIISIILIIFCFTYGIIVKQDGFGLMAIDDEKRVASELVVYFILTCHQHTHQNSTTSATFKEKNTKKEI